jgi:hypothetical protein
MLEYPGWWWLPDKADMKVAGVLRIQPEETPELELIGSLHEPYLPMGTVRPPIVLRVSTSCMKITLYKCSLVGERGSSLGTVSAKLHAQFVLEGFHFPSPPILFESMAMGFQHLADWTRLTGLKAHADLVAEELQFSASYRPPRAPAVAVGEWTIGVDLEFAEEGDSISSIVFKQRTAIQVTPNTPRSLESYLDDGPRTQGAYRGETWRWFTVRVRLS